jgi:hypothetical protein
MTRAWLVACLLMPLTAQATSFEEYGAGVSPRAAEQLSESSCEVAVDLRGAVASVELTQRIVNAGVKQLASLHRFTLPKGAAITSFAVKADKAVPVAAGFRSELVESASVLGADPAVLRKLGDDEYEILAQPFTGELVLTTKYAMLAATRSSTLRVVLPGRVAAAQLATCKGVIRAMPGPSTAVTAFRVDNAVVGNRSSAGFSLGAKDVAIDVELAISGNAPVVWQQAQTLSDGTTATLVTVLGPLVKAAAARKVVLLIDVSRSMDLVGRPNVVKVVKALGGALPAGSEIEAILFDRTATRVFNALRPANGENLAAIETALAKRGAVNGSDLLGAFQMAKAVIAGERGQPMIVAITDGVTGELADGTLTKALGTTASAVDVHAIVLDPARTTSPGAAVLRGPVNAYGGAYVEVHTDELDDALTAIDDWLRPSWLELALGDHEIPAELRSGAGFTTLLVGKPSALTLRGHATAAFVSPARPGPAAPVGVFAQPIVTDDKALAVLATQGRIAKNRIAMISGGGRYDRSVAVADPPNSAPLPATAAPIAASAIARITLERMFRDQLQPKAYVCYQRGIQRNNKLAAQVRFKLRMGRGEVSDVELTQRSGDPEFDKCLVDAAYLMTPPLPDFAVNADDQTVANYPLSFAQRQDQPVIVPGDADSESPIDIDAVEGGVPGARKIVKPDTKTPLGGMKPPKSP